MPWDYFRRFLGLPPFRNKSEWPEEGPSYERGSPAIIWEDDLVDDITPPGSFWRDLEALPTTLERDFQRQMEQLLRATFGLGIGSVVPELPPPTQDGFEGGEGRSLRDDLLKPGLFGSPAKDSDLDGRVDCRDVEKLLRADDRWFSGDAQNSAPGRIQPRFFSRSVTVRTIRRPDGSMETVRTERDGTGREETTVTTLEAPQSQPTPSSSPAQPQPPHDDIIANFFKF